MILKCDIKIYFFWFSGKSIVCVYKKGLQNGNKKNTASSFSAAKKYLFLQPGSWKDFSGRGTFITRARRARAVKVPEARKVCNSRVANITFCCTSSSMLIFLDDDVSYERWARLVQFVPCKQAFVSVEELELGPNFEWSWSIIEKPDVAWLWETNFWFETLHLATFSP